MSKETYRVYNAKRELIGEVVASSSFEARKAVASENVGVSVFDVYARKIVGIKTSIFL